ncbi:MAG TPA: MMPL family transporter, partial [Thermoguttaceae bacterium]|nr:MMPL family transporter [Thermoguttaceae bacterium]
DFTKNFRAGSPIVRSYEFVETNLGGAGVWDVVLPAPKRLDWKYLRRVRRLEDRLRNEVRLPGPNGTEVPGLTKVLSMADAVLANAPTDPDDVRSTLARNIMVTVAMKKTEEKIPVLEEALHGEDPQQPGHYFARIMLRARERQPAAHKRMLIEQVRRISSEEFPPQGDEPGAEVTGFFVLLANLISSMVRDQRLTFAVATLGIGLMMALVLRRPMLVLVAMVPNLLPIAMVTGLMGWAGLKINMGGAMIAAVSMGLSIDSSIHYLLSFRRARNDGHSVRQSLDIVQGTVGRAMVFSTLALVAGFMVLCTSQFVPVIYFGVLVSLSMAGGLAGNLVVLPLLLSLVTRDEKA